MAVVGCEYVLQSSWPEPSHCYSRLLYLNLGGGRGEGEGREGLGLVSTAVGDKDSTSVMFNLNCSFAHFLSGLLLVSVMAGEVSKAISAIFTAPTSFSSLVWVAEANRTLNAEHKHIAHS